MPIPVPVPFEVFSAELLPGERVEWSGQPNLSVIFHPEDALQIPFSLMWGGFSVFWVLVASGIWKGFAPRSNFHFQSFAPIWGIPFVLVGQYMIWGRFFSSRWRKRRTYYAITNRRALILVHGLGGRKATSAYFEGLSMIDKRVRSDGIGRISFGGWVRGEQKDRNAPPRPPTFDDVDEADSVHQIAERLRLDAAQKRTTI